MSRRYRMRGGVAPVNYQGMHSEQRASLDQGNGFLDMHKAQHGGSAPYPSSFGVSLPANMVAAARTGPLDSAMGSIQGMQDGGRRRRKSRKSKKSRKSRSRRHRRRHMRGGALGGAPVNGDSMLLSGGDVSKAGLHHEWADAAKGPGLN